MAATIAISLINTVAVALAMVSLLVSAPGGSEIFVTLRQQGTSVSSRYKNEIRYFNLLDCSRGKLLGGDDPPFVLPICSNKSKVIFIVI